MIVRFFKAGTSKGESPVRYLLSNEDHTRTPRAFSPEVLEGSPNTTIQIINGIARRHKYVSGVIAFRHSEQPTREDLFRVIDRFKAVAAPLHDEQFNCLWVLHKDKGNTELHFVFPMVLLGGTNRKGKDLTGRAMNIRPPGARSEEIFTLFQQVVNHELGCEQVVQNPLSVSLSNYWHKPVGLVSKQKIDLLERTMNKGIRQGRIGNREDLCHYFEEQLGVTITRKGGGYVSVRLPGDKKAIRLKGPLFESDSDYSMLVSQRRMLKQKTTLSETEYQRALKQLNVLVNERAEYMKGDYEPAKQQHSITTRRKNEYIKPTRRHQPTQRRSKFPNSANSTSRADRASAQRSAAIGVGNDTQFVQGAHQTQAPNLRAFSSSNQLGEQIERRGRRGQRGVAVVAQELREQIKQNPPITNGADGGLAKSLTSLQVQIDAVQAELANAPTLEERIRAEQRLIELIAQRNQLLAGQEEARKAELNRPGIRA